jgi:hypothetical protein
MGKRIRPPHAAQHAEAPWPRIAQDLDDIHPDKLD